MQSNRLRYGAISLGLVSTVAFGCSSDAPASGERTDRESADPTEAPETAETPETAATETTDPATASETTEAAGPAAAATATTAVPDQSEFETVIVQLAVGWRPPSELSGPEQEGQATEISGAKDAVLSALGQHGRLARPEDRLDGLGVPTLIVAVDTTGRQILLDNPLVAAVEENTTIEMR